MRIILSLFILSCFVDGFSQKLGSSSHNFGKVKDWNNPIFTTTYTNTSGEKQFFLPTNYSPDFRINFEKDMLQPGETTTVQMQYFTEEFGRFSKQIKVYVSTQDDPLLFNLSGNIVSIHPDAYTVCPRIENIDLAYGGGFNHNLKVYDAKTKEPVRDFEITIITDNSKERFRSPTSQVVLRRESPDRYTFEIDKEEYKIARKEAYVSRNSPETIIYLERETKEKEDYFDFNKPDKKQDEEILASNTTTQKENEKSESQEGFESNQGKKYGIDEDIASSKENKDDVPSGNEQTQSGLSWKDKIARNTKTKEDEPKKDTNSEDTSESDTEKIDKGNEPEPPVVVTPLKEDKPKPATPIGDFTSDGLLTSRYAFNHIVFLIDVSGSMNHETKLPLLKYSMYQMINVLRPEDRVSIITYSTEPIVLVRSISGANKQVLKDAISSLEAKGQSFGSDGVQMAYDLANDNFILGGNNEIILASDGVFTMENEAINTFRLERNISKQASENNIRLSSIGFGKAKNALRFLQDLSEKGDGSFITIKSEEQAQTILIDNMMKHSEIKD
ncbi:MAG: hypothetical protein RLZZ337_913 [Bacteroidota bacterium]|jgi:Ca-activated chloride channel family protein